jgi:hypothetical protein
VRLDHLLSKEHLALPHRGSAQSHISDECSEVASSLVEHWLFGLGSCPGWLVRSQCVKHTATWKARSQGLRRPSTLLGPEGTAAGLVASSGPNLLPSADAMEGGYRPYLENCTVDASIICSCQVNKGTR